jgi:hypothetical protein
LLLLVLHLPVCLQVVRVLLATATPTAGVGHLLHHLGELLVHLLAEPLRLGLRELGVYNLLDFLGSQVLVFLLLVTRNFLQNGGELLANLLLGLYLLLAEVTDSRLDRLRERLLLAVVEEAE